MHSRLKTSLIIIAIFSCIVFSILPIFSSEYILILILSMFVYIGYSIAWNIMSGLTGYVNFGFAAFVGVGSYASVLLITDLKMWWPLAWLCGGLASLLLAIILGSFMLKLRGSYFAIGMLSLLLGIKLLFSSKYLAFITRGGHGLSFIEPLDTKTMYYAIFVMTIISVIVSYKVITSKFGARLIAIREDEEGAASIGINTTKEKLFAFGLSAFLAGAIASGHIAYQNYIEPDSAFHGQWTIVPIVMVLLGGPGTVIGPIIGAIVLTLVEELLWSHFTQAYMIIYGIIMILLVMLMPGGVIEWLKGKDILPKHRGI